MDIVINEIHYHPASDCEEEEFIELLNTGGAALGIGGWSFLEGVPFEFPAGTMVQPGEHVVVARNPAVLRSVFGNIPRLYGPWGAWPGHPDQSTLANDGEDIVLANAAGQEVDRVRYNDRIPWPLSPDGGGPSLELICPYFPNDKAGNWRAAGDTGSRWIRYQLTGKVQDPVLRIYLAAAGEFLVDDVALEPSGGGASLVKNGGFEEEGDWSSEGNHSGSARAAGEAHTGQACLRVQATGPGGIADAVLQTVSGVVLDGPSYVLSFWAKRVDPALRLKVGFEGASAGFEKSEDIPLSVAPDGSSSYDSGTGTYTVRGAGADVWGGSDEFHFLHTALNGDGSIEAEVRWVNSPNTWGKAGLMVRETATATSKHAMAILSRDYGAWLQYRDSTSGASEGVQGPSTAGPVRLRLERQGSTFIAQADTGAGLREISRTTISLQPQVRVGLMVTSHQSGSIATAAFRSVVLNAASLRIATPLEDEAPPAAATPGGPNTQLSDRAPPYIRKVAVYPQTPSSWEEASVEAKVDNPDGSTPVTSVVLEYRPVLPGRYVRIADPEYRQGWISLPMRDDGSGGDLEPGDGTWTVRIPRQPNRTLVRYRIAATDAAGSSSRAPLLDDECPNLAYFVYDGVPDYVASSRSAHGPAPFTHSMAGLDAFPVYHLVTHPDDLEECWYSVTDYNDNTFRWRGTFVAGGQVYDNVRYRLRGGVWRYSYQKRFMKFKFLRGHHFEGIDNSGAPYPKRRTTLNLNSTIGNPNAGLGDRVRGESGVYESLAFALFRWMGVPAPQTTWVHFRIVRGEDEEGADQYSGDFYGIYLDIEQPDERFLEARGIPIGNLYKIEYSWEKEVNNCNPADDSDIRDFTSNLNGDPAWLEASIAVDGYLSYHAAVQMARHYDISWGKNYYYFHEPLTDLWWMLPWDVDLTFNTNYGGDGSDPFTGPILGSNPATFGLRFKNRLREGLDLLFREDRIFPVIDGYQGLLEVLARADRDRWETNPRGPVTFASHPQRMQELKDWIRGRLGFLNGLCADSTIPATPSILSPAPRSKLPPEGLAFAASPFAGSAGRVHASTRWIATKVAAYSKEGTVTRTDLIPPDEVWSFFRGKSEPAGAALDWTQPGYAAAGWEEGAVGIGYGDTVDVTVLGDMRGSYQTVYIRREFPVDDPAALTSLELIIDYDDAFIAYLNGTVVARSTNAPAGDVIPYNTAASITGHDTNGGETFRISGNSLGALVQGTNVLAIHGFNMSLGQSSDFTLYPALVGVSGEEGTGGPQIPLETLLAQNELAPQWDSGILEAPSDTVEIPPDAIETAPGTIYRIRVRHEDQAGRWSHWSPPLEIEIAASGDRSPQAVIDVSALEGKAPLEVDFSGRRSSDPEGEALTYSWDFGDGQGGEGASARHRFEGAGEYTVTLTVRDPGGKTGAAAVKIRAGYFYRRGDPNGDGTVDLSDVLRILFHLYAGDPEPACARSADANRDGKADLSDCFALLGCLFQGGPPPPPPFPGCAMDYSPGSLDCRASPGCP